MRLWHYKLISYLPKNQLIAQWKELNSIFKKQDKHILINYIYEYPKEDLYFYTLYIIQEFCNRNIMIRSFKNQAEYFKDSNIDMHKYILYKPVFKNHHTDRYLMQCFYNLQEKYDRGQKDFSQIEYKKLERFIYTYLKNNKEKELND